MNSTVQSSSKTGRQSLFFRDLATRVSTHGGKFTSSGQAAAVSALWRENFRETDPPPPPVFTLEERVEFSPESGIGDYPASPEFRSDTKTPGRESLSPLKGRGEAGASCPAGEPVPMQRSPSSLSWWSPTKTGSPVKSGVDKEKGNVSPMDGVTQPGALIMLPPPREVARPESWRNNLPAAVLDEEEWVTVYGFSPRDTNLVLREFEKCGTIMKHVPGPRDANWLHILYQNRFDAQKALSKNGLQINDVLIVGVKLVDPVQQQFLNEKLNSNQGFMVLPPKQSAGSMALTALKSSPRPYYPHSSDNNQRSTGAIASPAKSVVSRVMDLMFGI